MITEEEWVALGLNGLKHALFVHNRWTVISVVDLGNHPDPFVVYASFKTGLKHQFGDFADEARANLAAVTLRMLLA